MGKKHRSRRRSNKGRLKWGSKLDVESDYRILTDEIARIKNNDISNVERTYVRFKKEWLNIIKEGYEYKFYSRLSGKKGQLWKNIHLFYMNKPKSRQLSYSRMRKKMRSLTIPKSRSKSKKDKARSRWSKKRSLGELFRK